MRVIHIEVICKPRGCGKTYDLIIESARTETPILTPYNPRYIINLAREMGVKICQPITFNEYKRFRENRSLSIHRGWNGKVLIDEVDELLNKILDANVEKVTCTPDSMNERNNNMDYFSSKLIYDGYGNLKMISGNITDINVIVQNKVVEVTFADGEKEKMVCHKDDTFDLRNCLFIAIAKHLYKKDYTFEGIEWKAFELTHLKKYVKIVDFALKVYDRKQKEIARLEENYKAEQKSIERKRAKRQAYKERRAVKREQEEMNKQITIQKEAYLQAMKYMEDSKNVENK